VFERAHKWIQGRARPRELRLYEDWAKVVDLDRPGAWIADSELDEFIEVICARHNCDRDMLERRLESSRRSTAGQRQERNPSLAGTYACYSHSWSPYFRGQLIRGEFSIAQQQGSQGLLACYSERLPTSRLHLEGRLEVTGRAMHLDLRETDGNAHMLFCLFSPTPPASVLAGFMCGATIIDPDAQPSVTRMVMVRLPGPSMRLRSADAYLPPQASVAADLASLGLPIPNLAAVDHGVGGFLAGGQGGGLDQVAPTFLQGVDRPVQSDLARRRDGDAGACRRGLVSGQQIGEGPLRSRAVMSALRSSARRQLSGSLESAWPAETGGNGSISVKPIAPSHSTACEGSINESGHGRQELFDRRRFRRRQNRDV
jgi:hypothetical protein